MSKIFAKNLSDKRVMGTDGSEIGVLYNIIVDLRTGDLIDLVVKPDMEFDTSKFKMEDGFILIPFETVRAVKDYIVVDKKAIA